MMEAAVAEPNEPSELVTLLPTMRRIRAEASELRLTVVSDLRPFAHEGDKVTFRALPNSPSDDGVVSVATTCTALMSLLVNDATGEMYGSKNADTALREVFDLLMGDPWDSSRLKADNAFTAVLVLRAASMLLQTDRIAKAYVLDDVKRSAHTRFSGMSLRDIARWFGRDMPDSLNVDEHYTPHPAMGYWFVDAICTLRFGLSETAWRGLANWAREEYLQQLSFVSAYDYERADPVAMVMATCTLSRMYRESLAWASLRKAAARTIPTTHELRQAVRTFLAAQRQSGLWDRGFAIFHFPDFGTNYCWSFEALEAILREFPEIVGESYALQRLDRVLDWCTRYRRTYRQGKHAYFGWTSGQQRHTLLAGMPEAWATAVVHIFLARLEEALSHRIREGVLAKYGIRAPVAAGVDESRWTRFLDSDVRIHRRRRSLKGVIASQIIGPLRKRQQSPRAAPGAKLSIRSALLFGPPGTGKSSLVRAVAAAVGWPLLVLTPSHFLSKGPDNIYALGDGIFEDLQDLWDVVILFDEVDPMMQRRYSGASAPRPGVIQQFLTTSMLPRLSNLHGQGRVFFFLATNHLSDFEEAITRAERFDMLLCIGPPSWASKRKAFDRFLPSQAKAHAGDAAQRIHSWTQSEEPLRDLLHHATYNELRAFMRDFLAGPPKRLAVEEDYRDLFLERLNTWGSMEFSLAKKAHPLQGDPREEFDEDREKSRIQ